MEGFMRRVATFILLLAFAGPALAQVTGSVGGPLPKLKPAATVAGDLVRIGDLVENAGAVAGTPIFRAPDLGETGAVEAYRVIDAVRAHGLTGVDSLGVSEVVVTRPGRIVTLKDIEAAVARTLAARYGFGDIRNLAFTFDRDARPIHLEPSASADLQPTRVAYERGSGRFDVTYGLSGSGPMRDTQVRYTGSVVETREVVVLAHALARGETVKQANVLVERRPRSELSDDMSEQVADVIGLAARRPLRAGQPLRAADLMKHEIVQRGDPVTLVYQVPGVFLTMRGKALESGAEGDLVSVTNGQSKKTLQGTVSGPGRVTIASTVPHLDQAAAPSVQSDTRGK
jgi:flagella basal body P-ring formation protein FlgA